MRYPKVQKKLEYIKGNVVIEEKVDGSQFRINVVDGNLILGSKNVDFGEKVVDYENMEKIPKMFRKAVDVAKSLKIQDNNVTIFCEYLEKPKHNALAYDRIPKDHLVIFDVYKDGRWLNYDEKAEYAKKLGLEVVPKLYEGELPDLETIKKIVYETESFLGGQTIEGVVIKNYEERLPFDWVDTNGIFCKYVRQEFRELNNKEWKHGKKDFLGRMVERYATKARFLKAVQHLKEQGELEGEMRDLPKLMKEFVKDIWEEDGEDIREEFIRYFKRDFNKLLIKKLPMWYQDYLFGGT